MTTRRVLTCLLLVAFCGSTALGELDEKEQKRRLRSLKSRAGEYLQARKGLVKRCQTCNGSGRRYKITPGTGGTKHRTVDCGTCNGHGSLLSLKHYMKLEYHLKSPAFRMKPRAFRQVESRYKNATRSAPPPRIMRTATKGAVLHGDDHGITLVRENAEKEYRPLLWIWAVEPGKKTGGWYLYDESVDGPWPDAADLVETEMEEETESFGTCGGEPLEADEILQLEKALKPIALTFAVTEEARKDDVLMLLLEPGTGASKNLRDAVTSDSIALVRALWGAFPQLDAIHLHYVATFKDRFGNLEKKPYVFAQMDGVTFKKINWTTLEEAEVFRLFQADWKHHSGWKVYR